LARIPLAKKLFPQFPSFMTGRRDPRFFYEVVVQAWPPLDQKAGLEVDFSLAV